MRKKLGKLKNRKYTFTGRVEKVNYKNTLVCGVQLLDGTYVTQHVWISNNNVIRGLKLRKGDIVRFKGVPGIYYKGDHAEYLDYRIGQISELKIIEREFLTLEDLFWIKNQEQINDFANGFFETEEELFLAENDPLEDEFDSEIRFSVQAVLDTLLPAVLYDEIDFK